MKVDIEPKSIAINSSKYVTIFVRATSFRMKRTCVRIESKSVQIRSRDENEEKTIPKGKCWEIPVELKIGKRDKHKIDVYVTYTDMSGKSQEKKETVYIEVKEVSLPDLDVHIESLETAVTQNNVCTATFTIENKGSGDAQNVLVSCRGVGVNALSARGMDVPAGTTKRVQLSFECTKRGKIQIDFTVTYKTDQGELILPFDVTSVPFTVQNANPLQPPQVNVTGEGHIVNIGDNNYNSVGEARKANPTRRYAHTGSKNRIYEGEKEFSNVDVRTFRECILKAFDEKGFEQMLYCELNKDLKSIVKDDDFSSVVYQVIRIAQREGWIIELVETAYQANPGNPKLARFWQELSERG